MEPILEMIKTLTGINSPSGDTEEAIQFVEKYAKDLGYQTTLTNKGALLITVPGKNDEVQRCITAHVDTLGAMVKEIKEDGRLAIELMEDSRITRLRVNIAKLKLMLVKYIQEQFVCMKQVFMYIEIIMKYLETKSIWKLELMK